MSERPPLNRERDLGAIISDSFTLLFADPGKLFAVVMPAVLVSIATNLLLLLAEPESVAYLLISLASLPALYGVQQLVTAGAVQVLVRRDRGEDVQVGDALDSAQDHAGALIGAALRAMAILALLCLTIIGIPFALYRAIRWLFLIQAIMIDEQAGEPSLAYSANLVQGCWWITFGRSVASGLVVGLPAIVAGSLIQAAFPDVLGVILAALPFVFTSAFFAVSTTLLFFDLKARKAVHDVVSIA